MGNSCMIVLTIFFMILGFLAFGWAGELFEGKDVTTLGASAVVMILVNAQAWPYLLETM